MGKDTYMMSKNGTAIAVGSNLKAELYREADAWCRQQGLVMVPVSESQKDGIAGVRLGSAEIVFRAVKADDIENQRTNLRQSPDTVIEVRTPTAAATDKFGLTAIDYEELAKQYDANGKPELARAARERAAELRGR